MSPNEKKELEEDIEQLYQDKIDLEEQIRKLDGDKIQKLQTANDEFQKRVDWLEKHTKKLTKDHEYLERQIKHCRARKWFNALKMVILLAVIDLIIPLVVTLLQIPLQWLFISLGIVTFFGILIISNYMSHTNPFDTGEIRKALTSTFLLLYLVFIPLVTFGNIMPAGGILNTIITYFSLIVIFIIGFYFGTRGLEEYRKIKEKK